MKKRRAGLVFASLLIAGGLFISVFLPHKADRMPGAQPADASGAAMSSKEYAIETTGGDEGNSDADTAEQDTGTESVPEDPAVTLEDIRKISFSDVPAEDPASDSICYVAYQHLLLGVGDGRFAPDMPVTRAALMTVLFRSSGAESTGQGTVFSDVPADIWYADAVTWAEAAGIAHGNSDGTFAPDAYVSRAQLAVFLFRYASWLGTGTAQGDQMNGRPEIDDVPGYARKDMLWALSNGLYNGVISNDILPHFPVSRAQLAQVLTAFLSLTTGDPLAQELSSGYTASAPDSACLSAHAEIQKVVDTVASQYGAVGLQVAVIEGGRVTDSYVYGWAVKNSVPMTSEHKIRVASITKVAVGIGAMLLREQGVIDLDDDIGPYWGAKFRNPHYPDVPITFRSLLSHTSSIRVLEDASRTRGAIQSTLSGSSGYSNLHPGSIWSWNYNNYGFGVLGTTLELASGRFLDDILSENIWSYLDIDAAFESGNVRKTDKIAALYYHDGSLSRSQQMQQGIVRPDSPGTTGSYFAGGLTISVLDLAKMVALLANDGCYEGVRFLEDKSVKTMETYFDQRLPEGFYQALPLRYQTDIYGRDSLFYHTGSAYGVYNCISYDPVTRDGVAVLTVGASAAKDSYGIYAVCGNISEYIYDTVLQ